MLFLDASRALTCHGCGQVGPRPTPQDDSSRSIGFYLFHDGSGLARVACCRCQQIQPGAGITLAQAPAWRVQPG